MSSQSDVVALKVSGATTQTTIGRVRIKAVWIVTTAVAGSVVIREGSASGAILLETDTAAVAGQFPLFVPQNGVLFESSPYVALSNVTSATIFYG